MALSVEWTSLSHIALRIKSARGYASNSSYYIDRHDLAITLHRFNSDHILQSMTTCKPFGNETREYRLNTDAEYE